MTKTHRLADLSHRIEHFVHIDNQKKEAIYHRHSIPLEELCKELNTDPVSGLSHVAAKHEHNTINVMNAHIRKPSKNHIKGFILTLTGGFSCTMWVAATLMLICALINCYVYNIVSIDQFTLAVGLMIFEFLGTCFEYLEDVKGKEILDLFNNVMPETATVIRDGETIVINAVELVEGDLIYLKEGNVVPADVRIIEVTNLKMDKFAITGETEPETMTTDNTNDDILKSTNVAFFATTIVEGNGLGIVIACGNRSVLARIAHLTASVKSASTSMTNDINRFVFFSAISALAMGFMCGLIYYILSQNIIMTLILTTDLIMSNVPGFFMQSIKLTLIIGGKRLTDKNCIVRNAESIISLGATSVICTDKTGTITKNLMRMSRLWYSGHLVTADLVSNLEEFGFEMLIRCAFLNNRVNLSTFNEKSPLMTSEDAAIRFIKSLNIFDQHYRDLNPKVFEMPFSFEKGYQLSVHWMQEGFYNVLLKGVPETVLTRCDKILYDGETRNLNNPLMNILIEICAEMAETAEKVTAFCDLQLDLDEYPEGFSFSIEPSNFPRSKMRFLGFISYSDPLRIDVGEAIILAKLAGIKVTLVTGDHLQTAKSIATKVGILTLNEIYTCKTIEDFQKIEDFSDSSGIAIDGSILKELSNSELESCLVHFKEIVFARVTANQKLHIVECYQRLGEVVTVTGDGINDAPALKRADTGIAMGSASSEVIHKASDIIVMDDNFTTIIEGVREGRRMFDNLKKAILFKLSSNVPQIIATLAYMFLNVPMILGVQNILFIDLITDIIPMLCFVYEKAERNIMLRPPRNPIREKLISRKLYFLAYGHLGLIETLAAMALYFIIMAEYGFLPKQILGLKENWERNSTLEDSFGRNWTLHERQIVQYQCTTGYMMAVIVLQFANSFACRTRIISIWEQKINNLWLNLSSVIILPLGILICFIGKWIYNGEIFYWKFWPLNLFWWLYTIPFAIYLVLFDEFRKWHIRHYPKGWFQRETCY